MSPRSTPEPQAGEIARIRAEYRRRDREIPPDFYALSRPVNQFFDCQLARACISALGRARLFPLDRKRIADIGCGRGSWLLQFLRWGAEMDRLSGIDLDEARLAAARARLDAADLRLGDASCLPWPDESFDLVTQFTVFTSILDPLVRQRVAAEMLRVLSPGGVILWYDFRFDNPRNPAVRAATAGQIRALFPGCRIALQKVTLAPPLARLVVPLSWCLALALEALPFLRSHYLGVIRKSVA